MAGYLIPTNRSALPLDREQVEQAGRDKAQSDFSVELLKCATRQLAHEADHNYSLVSSGLLGAESMDKEALLGSLLRLGRRGASSLARRGGRIGRVGRQLQRPIQSPIQLSRGGAGEVVGRLRSPLGKPPVRGAVPSKGAKDLIADTMGRAKKERGLVRGALRSVALPAAVVGGGLLAYKGGKGLINVAEQMANAPPAYGYGVRQYQYGFTPEGQAQF